MKTLMLSGLAFATLALCFPAPVHAHGGQYRGPGDIVPPNPGGGGNPVTPRPGGVGPTTPRPGFPSVGPTTPGGGSVGTGGSSRPGTQPGAGATGRRSITLEDDFSQWEYWWEYNKDPFIRLKEAIHAGGTTTGSEDIFLGPSGRSETMDLLRPSETDKRDIILPALKRALDGTDNRDITSSCMVAMAKIGIDHDSFKILPEFKNRLTSNDQEIRETAALALGISQMPAAIGDLVHLLKDTPVGRKLVHHGEVDDRTRTFAAYGLGLIAFNTSNTDEKIRIFDALKTVLEDEKASSRNIKVGVINAMRLLQPQPKDAEKTEKTSALKKNALDTLMAYYSKQLGQGEQLIQASVPPAIASLLGRGGDKDGRYKDVFAAELTTAGRSVHIYQSAVLALGALAESGEAKTADKKYSDALQSYYKSGKDHQAKYFSLISLAKIGGTENRNYLLTQLNTGQRATERPWAGLALGVLAFMKNESEGANTLVDQTIGEALKKQLEENSNPSTVAAMAVALGLAKHIDASTAIHKLLNEKRQQDDLAGYLCIGLALMNDQRAIHEIKTIVTTSVRRPILLRQAAIALGKLGDKEVATMLQGILQEDDQNLGKLSAVASALGYIGDKRSIDPLVKMLFNDSITPLSRAFAAVALGGVADKEPLPWNSKIGVDLNYRASAETLTNGSSGILDIL